MCGRFALDADAEQIATTFKLTLTATAVPLTPRYNIAPTQPVAAIRHDQQGDRELTHFHWGLIPHWAQDKSFASRLINARSETVAEKPSFRHAFQHRRCLIPTTGFYEWQKQGRQKQPIFITLTQTEPFAFAGLWEYWTDASGDRLQSCTILTTPPN